MVLEAGHGFTVVFPLYVQVPTAGKYWVMKDFFPDNSIYGIFHIFVNGQSVSSVYDGSEFTVGPRSSERWVDGHYRSAPEANSWSYHMGTNKNYTEIGLLAGVNRLVVVYTNNSQSAYMATCRFNIMPAGGDGSPLQYFSPKDLNNIQGKLVYQCIPALNSVSGLDEGSVKGAVYYVADMNYSIVRGSGSSCYPVSSCSTGGFGENPGTMAPYPYPLKTTADVLVPKNPWPRAYVSWPSENIFSTCFNTDYFRGGTASYPQYPNTWWIDLVSVVLPAWQYEVRASWFGFARGEIYQGGRWPIDGVCMNRLGQGDGTATRPSSTSLPAGSFPWTLTARTTTPDPSTPSISVTKPEWTASFSTIAGFASAARRMLITGTNLTQNVTVDSDTDYPTNTASNGFEISADGVTWVDTLTLTPVSGSLNQSVYVRVSSNNTNPENTAITKTGEIVVRGGVSGFEFVEPVTAIIQSTGSLSPIVGATVTGYHLYHAIFPVYCWSDTARTASVTSPTGGSLDGEAVDDDVYASVNGGNVYRVGGYGWGQSSQYPASGQVTLRAGWNRIVFIHFHETPTKTALRIQVQGATLWSPTVENLKNCIGKLAKDCISDLTITTNNPASAGLENNVKGIFYYFKNDGGDPLPIQFQKIRFPSFIQKGTSYLTPPPAWSPLEPLQAFDYYFQSSAFNFYVWSDTGTVGPITTVSVGDSIATQDPSPDKTLNKLCLGTKKLFNRTAAGQVSGFLNDVPGETSNPGDVVWGINNPYEPGEILNVVAFGGRTHPTYDFAYFYQNDDWIVRRNRSSGEAVAVIFMGNGGPKGGAQNFRNSNRSNLVWGNQGIPWDYLLQTESHYQTAGNIVDWRGFTPILPTQPPPIVMAQWELLVVPTPKTRRVVFTVDMSGEINRTGFTNGHNKVQIKGLFSNWGASIFGRNLRENLYEIEAYISGDAGTRIEYKYWADGPGWESLYEGNRFFNLGPVGVDHILPTELFNNLRVTQVNVGSTKLNQFYMGDTRVTAIYYGAEQVFP